MVKPEFGQCIVPRVARDSDGYPRIQYKGRWRLVSRLLMEVLGYDIKGRLLTHDCDYPPCISPEHLHIGDEHSNAIEARDRGLSHAKITMDDADEIRRLYATGRHTQRGLGYAYRLCESQIGEIVRRESWN